MKAISVYITKNQIQFLTNLLGNYSYVWNSYLFLLFKYLMKLKLVFKKI